MRKLGIPTTLDDSFSKPCCRFCNGSGTRRSPNTATVFDRDARPIKRWHRRKEYPKATAGWLTSTWKSFSDRVNHDKLMGQIAKRVKDKRLRKLIRAFLKAGVMEGGLVSPAWKELHQGGPLSPLL